MLKTLKRWASLVKRDVFVLFLAARDPQVPFYAKALVMAVLAYALSPIDLIPDFIPILGYLDDLILLPLVIRLALWLIPDHVVQRLRQDAENKSIRLAKNMIGALLIVFLWLAFLIFVLIHFFA